MNERPRWYLFSGIAFQPASFMPGCYEATRFLLAAPNSYEAEKDLLRHHFDLLGRSDVMTYLETDEHVKAHAPAIVAIPLARMMPSVMSEESFQHWVEECATKQGEGPQMMRRLLVL